MKTIFHLDLDTFFVSVERILDPTLNGVPVVVGGDPEGRGVVAACSYEARKYGLHSAMPIRTAYKLCPHARYLHGHFTEYSLYSKGVKKILEQYAPVIEQASIDEFYMDFTGCKRIYGSLFMFAEFLQREILEKLQLPCSIGIGSNKTIAKIGSDCMKPKGITYILPGLEKEFLAPMPIETIPGVGKVMQRELNSRGFYKIGDIAKTPQEYFSCAFGKAGIDVWRKAHGEGNENLTIEYEQKSISKETTFDRDVVSLEILKEVLFDITGKVCQLLRDHNWQASNIGIKLRYNDFKTLTRVRTVNQPLNDDKKIFELAWDLFEKAYTRRVAVRLVGIHLTKFTEASEQGILFETEEEKRQKMLSAVDSIRNKYGFKTIKLGS